ncbi:glycosyltransferase family 39 protein [Candidatus Daviesbacteria bacterium]|nr:glycosyltransferase family 39 protein [Candidatus Daviesbacteria bacterium]
MKQFFLPLLLSLAFLMVGILTLSDYGINWDAPIRMLRGQAYLYLFLTGQKTYGEPERISPLLLKPGEYAARYNFLDTPGGVGRPVELPNRPLPRLEFENAKDDLGERRSFYQHEAWNGAAAISVYDEPGHLPLSDILSALTNKIFYQKLGLFGDIESFQLFYIFISALGIFLVSLFTYQITNSYFAAFVAGLSLALYPLFITEAHVNMKDPLQATFFTGSIWSFWHWVKSSKFRWFLVFTAFVAGALGIKWNIIFLPFILIPWLFFIRKTAEFKAWFKLGRLGLLGLLGGLEIFLFLVAIWPYAWADPVGKMFSVTKYYLDIGLKSGSQDPENSLLFLGFNLYPLVLVLFRTPEIVLILAAIGTIAIIRGATREVKVGYLLLFWLLVVILRQILPGMRLYMGLRQIMEILPAFAMLCGIGTTLLLRGRSKKTALVLKLCIMIPFIILLIKVIQIHPNENVYFNSFAGGLKGAQQKELLDWKITYGNVYKQAALWLNENAETNANLALLDGSMFALSPLWLREDISISPDHFSGFERQGEYILSVLNQENPPVFAHRYPIRFLKPIHSITIDGVTLLTIYKNDPQFLNPDIGQEQILTNPPLRIVKDDKGDFLEIDLEREVKVTRLMLDDALPQCRFARIKRIVDTYIDFVPISDLSKSTAEVHDPYLLHERNSLPDDRVEYFFAGEKAKLIRIFPKNPFSCFFKGRIDSVTYLNFTK